MFPELLEAVMSPLQCRCEFCKGLRKAEPGAVGVLLLPLLYAGSIARMTSSSPVAWGNSGGPSIPGLGEDNAEQSLGC